MINWNNPITKGLVFDSPMREGGGSNIIRESVSKLKGTFNNTPSWTKEVMGPAINFTSQDGAQAILFTTSGKANNFDSLSIEMLINMTTMNSINNDRFIQSGDGVNYRWAVITNTSSSNVIDFSKGMSILNDEWKLPAIALGVWNHVIITVNGLTTTTSISPIAYINGLNVAVTNVTTSNGTSNSDTSNLTIGNIQGNLNRGINGKMAYIRYWNRILSPYEVRSLYSNPWQIYVIPPIQKSFSAPTVVAGQSISNWIKMQGVGQA